MGDCDDSRWVDIQATDFHHDNDVLQTRPLCESHTGVHIAKVLVEAQDEWKLDK
jgi:hypothetical protein